MSGFDEDLLVATMDLGGRTGARNIQIGHLNDEHPAEWYVQCQYNGDRIIVDGFDTPDEACAAFATRILDGAYCARCGGHTVTLDTVESGKAIPLGGRPANTERLTRSQRRRIQRTEARSKPPCVWYREGRKWIRGCEGVSRETA